MRRLLLSLCLLPLATAAHAEPLHGIAMHGEPALSADYSHFPYVKPDAPTVPAFMPASPEVTGAIPRLNRPDDASQLKAGLDALSGRDAARAIALQTLLPGAAR